MSIRECLAEAKQLDLFMRGSNFIGQLDDLSMDLDDLNPGPGAFAASMQYIIYNMCLRHYDFVSDGSSGPFALVR